MAKVSFKPGNMLYPLPAVMVSVTDRKGNDNIVTVAWTGTICTNPPMVYISVRPERHSYKMIEETGEFVINLTTQALCYATDYCGVKTGKDIDKFEDMHLTKEKAQVVSAPLIAESPLNIECKVREKRELGSHTMFIADVVAVNADDKFINAKGTFDLNSADLLAYSHGTYFGLGKKIGKFGYSVDKKNTKRLNATKKKTAGSKGHAGVNKEAREEKEFGKMRKDRTKREYGSSRDKEERQDFGGKRRSNSKPQSKSQLESDSKNAARHQSPMKKYTGGSWNTPGGGKPKKKSRKSN